MCIINHFADIHCSCALLNHPTYFGLHTPVSVTEYRYHFMIHCCDGGCFQRDFVGIHSVNITDLVDFHIVTF